MSGTGSGMRKGFYGRQVQHGYENRRQHAPLQAAEIAVRPRNQHGGTSPFLWPLIKRLREPLLLTDGHHAFGSFVEIFVDEEKMRRF